MICFCVILFKSCVCQFFKNFILFFKKLSLTDALKVNRVLPADVPLAQREAKFHQLHQEQQRLIEVFRLLFFPNHNTNVFNFVQ